MVPGASLPGNTGKGGKLHKVKEKARETAGKIISDSEMEIAGRIENTAGIIPIGLIAGAMGR